MFCAENEEFAQPWEPILPTRAIQRGGISHGCAVPLPFPLTAEPFEPRSGEGGARAVGNALHINPFAPSVPCHRVVACDGSLAEHFGDGGSSVQRSRLEAEGVQFIPGIPHNVNKQSRVDLAKSSVIIEKHPLKPFLPHNGRILFLGSFPPPKARWSMEFFYPNWINDFWRIQGLIRFGDARYFESVEDKRFDYVRITDFCRNEGLAFYDIASKTVIRLYHLSPSQCRKFFEAFKRFYFGASWDSPQVERRIHDAAMVRCCALIKENPDKASLYVPLIHGKIIVFRLRKVLAG